MAASIRYPNGIATDGDGICIAYDPKQLNYDCMYRLRALVSRQAKDEGLWDIDNTTIEEAYLQQELRKLHAAVEAYLDTL